MADSTPDRRDGELEDSVYAHLHRLAASALARETPGHSLQPTLLVNDAYMRLLDQKNIDRSDRSQVLAAGASIIRRLLVDYARKRKADKRGGHDGRGLPLLVSVAETGSPLEILELNDALHAFAQENERAAKVVELKFFGGLSNQEIAEELSVSQRTVTSDWSYAKAWLYRHLSDDRSKD